MPAPCANFTDRFYQLIFGVKPHFDGLQKSKRYANVVPIVM